MEPNESLLQIENIPQKPHQLSNKQSATKHKLGEALDKYACVYEQIFWSQSFDFEVSPDQIYILKGVEKDIEQLDPVTFKKLQSLEPETLETIITVMSGEERINALTESIENTSIKINKMTVEPTTLTQNR